MLSHNMPHTQSNTKEQSKTYEGYLTHVDALSLTLRQRKSHNGQALGDSL